MNLFTVEKRFHPKTGKPVGDEFVESENLICDFTGELIDCEDYQNRPLYSVHFDYNHDCEEVYYYDDDKEYFEQLDVEYSNLFENKPYHFLPDNDGGDASWNLMFEWWNCLKSKKGDLADCKTIEDAMRKARVRTIKKLLKSKKYTIEEFGL
jgi:hypothetical protein